MTADLTIQLRHWRDATRTPETIHPEVVISATSAGLRALQNQISFLLQSTAGSEAHTHLLDGDPGIQTAPPRLMLTLALIAPPAAGADVHFAP